MSEESNKKKYVGDILGGGLLITESIIVAKTLLKNLPENEWNLLFTEQNILQKNSINSALRNANTARRRLLPLGESYIRAVSEASDSSCIQLLMLAVLIDSPIVVDFMQEVLAETKRTYKPALPSYACDAFMSDRIKRLPELASYSESTLKKIGSNIIRVLVQAGYLDTGRKKQLRPVYVLPETKEWIMTLQREELERVMESTL